jgi:hypothetical protein
MGAATLRVAVPRTSAINAELAGKDAFATERITESQAIARGSDTNMVSCDTYRYSSGSFTDWSLYVIRKKQRRMSNFLRYFIMNVSIYFHVYTHAQTL